MVKDIPYRAPAIASDNISTIERWMAKAIRLAYLGKKSLWLPAL